MFEKIYIIKGYTSVSKIKGMDSSSNQRLVYLSLLSLYFSVSFYVSVTLSFSFSLSLCIIIVRGVFSYMLYHCYSITEYDQRNLVKISTSLF